MVASCCIFWQALLQIGQKFVDLSLLDHNVFESFNTSFPASVLVHAGDCMVRCLRYDDGFVELFRQC